MTITGSGGRSIVIDGEQLYYVRGPGADPGTPRKYGQFANYYTGTISETTAHWSPEVYVGQFYTQSSVVLGFYHELLEFAQALLEDRPFSRADLADCRLICRIGELFREGPGRLIEING